MLQEIMKYNAEEDGGGVGAEEEFIARFYDFFNEKFSFSHFIFNTKARSSLIHSQPFISINHSEIFAANICSV